MDVKICSRCEKEIPTCEFGVDRRNKTGLRSSCNNCRKIESKLYRLENGQKRKETVKKYYENNKEKELNRLKTYREENKEKRKITKTNWVNTNKDYYNKYIREWKKNRRETCPLYKLITNIRSRTKFFLKNNNYSKKTFDVVGCKPDELKNYLESKFIKGMSWDNYGFYGWHVDHIIPLSSAKTEEEIYKLCHFSNLQPLWCTDNLKKGNKY